MKAPSQMGTKEILNRLNKIKGLEKNDGNYMTGISEILECALSITREKEICSCAVIANDNIQLAAGIGMLSVPLTLFLSSADSSATLKDRLRENAIFGDIIGVSPSLGISKHIKSSATTKASSKSSSSEESVFQNGAIDLAIFCPCFGKKTEIEECAVQAMLKASKAVMGVIKSENKGVFRGRFPNYQHLSTFQVEIELSKHYTRSSGNLVSYDIFRIDA